jgi:shikimate kinase
MPFYDTMGMVHKKLKLDNPQELFQRSGVVKLMAAQRDLFSELTALDGPAIIEVWPEGVLEPSNAEVIKKMGTIIYIHRKTNIALAVAEREKKTPLLHEMSTGKTINLLDASIKLYAEESVYFEIMADMILENNGSEDEAVERLADMIRKHRGSKDE